MKFDLATIGDYYDSAAVQRVSGLFWPILVMLEEAKEFPARVDASGVWLRKDVDAWIAANRVG